MIDSLIKVVPETHKDHKRVLNLNGRSLTLIGIPEGLSISGGQFEVKRAVQRSTVPAGHTPSEWSANRKLARTGLREIRV